MSDTLPPLPEPCVTNIGIARCYLYTADQLRAYALQAAAVEREKVDVLADVMSGAINFWANYSHINEEMQDELSDARDDILTIMAATINEARRPSESTTAQTQQLRCSPG